jgi:hypothetical protein
MTAATAGNERSQVPKPPRDDSIHTQRSEPGSKSTGHRPVVSPGGNGSSGGALPGKRGVLNSNASTAKVVTRGWAGMG